MSICDRCQTAGYANSKGLLKSAQLLHSMCVYPGSCSCQHATGGGWINERYRETSAVPGTEG